MKDDNNPSGISGREVNGGRNYFMINLRGTGAGSNSRPLDLHSDKYLCSDTEWLE